MLRPGPLILAAAWGCAPVPAEDPRPAAPEPAPTSGGPGPPVPLADMASWALVDGPDSGDLARCTPLDFGAEPGGFEVRTEACDGATFRQPLLADLAAGDPVEVTLSHLDLWAPEPAEAELALEVDGVALWRARLPIPSPAGVLREVVPAPTAASGQELTFRVRNHGRNSYLLVGVTRLDHPEP